jgi:CBS domain containing-hemolysin-like protein
MVVVINAFEEPVGVITIGSLLEELVGQREVDDFDGYEDRAAVAAWKLQPVTVEVTDEEPSQEPTEVVESH